MHTNPILGLIEAMRGLGFEPADSRDLVADGKLRRTKGKGGKPGSKNIWYRLHEDFGFAGLWGHGNSGYVTWHGRHRSSMSHAEFARRMRDANLARLEAQRQREVDHQAAAERAAMLWSKATPAKPDHHRYLVRKRIPPGNARQSGDLLVLRIEDVSGTTRSLQYIGPDGTKRMLSGGAKKSHFIIVAGALPADLVVICEGWATGATLAAHFAGACALAAIDAGNLEPVALAIRARYPAAEIVIAADDDRLTPGNPGLTKARAAAGAVGGKLVKPVWPDGAPESLSDFNDLAAFMMEVSS
jgi:putative DNA primase/helicase